MTFDKAITHILEYEGGYVNHPNDPGGETNFGITKRSYPDLDIRNLTKEDAIRIYERDYWRSNRIDVYPASIRLQMFDMCVNMGSGNAVKVLQNALNVFGAGLTVDGKAGPKTMAAIENAPVYLAQQICIERCRYYVNLCLRREKSRVFLLGWIKRAVEVSDV